MQRDDHLRIEEFLNNIYSTISIYLNQQMRFNSKIEETEFFISIEVRLVNAIKTDLPLYWILIIPTKSDRVALDFSIYIILLFNLQGIDQGRLTIHLSPCSPNGHILTEEHFIDQPDELLNKPYNFKVFHFLLTLSINVIFLQITLHHIELNDENYSKGLRIRYKVFNELEFSETNVICRNTISARISQTRIISIPSIDSVR